MDATDDSKPHRLIDYSSLSEVLRQFASDRDWEKFHSPKNLVMALTGEVGELVEVFQWMSEEASRSAARDPQTAGAVREELADVLLYVVRAADVLGVDLNAAVVDKLRANAEKYPVDAARGTSKKYTEL
ncbi:nucleotide pyrophosphohydrolase [uncultured Piscinibacter sp.]|uniref:nucleotide pyrophosphohydrolase n=1 Tax=uncultured Piscinibacter sp. TaxID=1131835 RepID=UPI00260C43CE|nr:nucleotide pyrophosphohydrolase [uncultured Piscinibacter sp.]